ncbi:MAG: T9SS type A sorting domain-containing protein [Bacteroidota bacterium]|nr:T9SS type A sorting domain-containing protein [Bacteroidota bacterium]MDP4232338.1 T9SS type A sorting domain-containing protein [Bacteroidota bacterium]
MSSNIARCYAGPPQIFAYYDSIHFYGGASYYVVEGVVYDPKIVGKISAPGTVYCGSVAPDSIAEIRIDIRNDSFAQYRQIKLLSVRAPFNLDDTIEMMYPCTEFITTPNCSFHPIKPGHYSDTAYLLDPLTNDSIPLILIGECVAAGVADHTPTPQLRLFPSPCDRQLNVWLSGEEASSVEIWNVMGKRVYSNRNAKSELAVDCSLLPAGVYFVDIRATDRTIRRRLIVSR